MYSSSSSVYRTGFTGNVAHLTRESTELVVLALEGAALLLLFFNNKIFTV